MNKKAVPQPVPPGSIFKLVTSDHETLGWKGDVGRIFRIGYYSEKDGLDCIWLVNEKGEYEQTTDREYLLKYFEPLELSSEAELYGKGKPAFGPLL
jgi:hypothetical protein